MSADYIQNLEMQNESLTAQLAALQRENDQLKRERDATEEWRAKWQLLAVRLVEQLVDTDERITELLARAGLALSPAPPEDKP